MDMNEIARESPSEAAQDEILATILKKIGGSGEHANSGASVGTGATSTGGGGASGSANPLGDIFSSVLSNPELLSKLPTIISSVKPIIEMLGKGFSTGTAATPPTDTSVGTVAASAEETASATMAKGKDFPVSAKSSDSRTALLCAMKPYLSDDRRNAVDYIVKLSRLGEILKTL